MKPSTRLYHWRQFQTAQDHERERLSILNGPLPKNDPALLTPIRCRVIRGFCVSGKPVVIGEIVSIERHLALSLKSTGKVEIVVD